MAPTVGHEGGADGRRRRVGRRLVEQRRDAGVEATGRLEARHQRWQVAPLDGAEQAASGQQVQHLKNKTKENRVK